MKGVSTRFGDVIHIGAGGTPKNSEVAVAHNGRFLDLVQTKKKVEGPIIGTFNPRSL